MQRLVEVDSLKRNPIHLPVLLHDLAFGMVIRDYLDGTLGVQVPNEEDMRTVSIENVYTENGALIEVLPVYTDAQLFGICEKLMAIDPNQARKIIDRLEQVGFDVRYEDYRTIQGDYVYTFFYDIPKDVLGKLIIHSIGHRPSFCAKFGHTWGHEEFDPDGDVYATCSHCGKREQVTGYE